MITINYKQYKFNKIAKMLVNKIISIIFYLPRQLYKNSNSFKSFIKNTEAKHYKKKRIKQLSKNIFYDLEKQEECVVLIGCDYNNDFYFDRQDLQYELLLSNDNWINKNNLNIIRMTVKEYMEQDYKEKRYLVSDYFGEKIVCIISKR